MARTPLNHVVRGGRLLRRCQCCDPDDWVLLLPTGASSSCSLGIASVVTLAKLVVIGEVPPLFDLVVLTDFVEWILSKSSLTFLW